jgi:hypothetical protein
MADKQSPNWTDFHQVQGPAHVNQTTKDQAQRPKKNLVIAKASDTKVCCTAIIGRANCIPTRCNVLTSYPRSSPFGALVDSLPLYLFARNPQSGSHGIYCWLLLHPKLQPCAHDDLEPAI